MSFPWLIFRIAGGVLEAAAENQLAIEKFRALMEWFAEVKRARAFFEDGSWHSEGQIIQEFGANAGAILEEMLEEGHSFNVSGRYLKMVPRGLSSGPLRRGTITMIPPAPRPILLPVTKEMKAVIMNIVEATLDPKPRNSGGQRSADHSQPQPAASPLPRTAAKDMTADGHGAYGGRSESTQAKTTAGTVPTPMPVAAVSGTAAATKASGGGTQQPMTSRPSSALSKPSSSAPRQASQNQVPHTQIANPVLSLKESCTGHYNWLDSPANADLIAGAIVSRYQHTCLAVDIVRSRRRIARVDVDLEQSTSFMHFFQVGLLLETDYFGERILRCDAIGQYDVGSRHVFGVQNEDLAKLAPRIVSYSKSLRLREDRKWELPRLPGERTRDFAIRCRWADIDCLPVIVDIDQRKNTEPVVTLHFYIRRNYDKSRNLELCGVGYTSWSSAIALAHWSRVGVKIALPKGGWVIAYLLADVKTSSDGKEYGRGLQLDVNSLREAARPWASSFPSVFHLPLTQARNCPELDWTNGFPPVLYKKRSRMP